MSHFYLNRDGSFSEVQLLETTKHKRKVMIKDGEFKGKEKSIHPEGVSWGRFYPRLFKTNGNPPKVFIYKGRVLSEINAQKTPLTPDIDESYRFQDGMRHIIDSINAKENILLTGGTGTGKTSQILQLAARVNQCVRRINFNGETRMSDFLGKMNVIDGRTVWVDGVLPTAMRNGEWLLLDELDFADAAVLSILHPVLESSPSLSLKENSGEVIKPHPNFRVFATANSIGAMQDRSSNYSGTTQMNEAFLDRWQVLMVPNLSQKEELRIVRNNFPGLKSSWAKKIVEFAHKVRNKEDDSIQLEDDNFSTRKVMAWAKKTALLRSPIEGAKLSWLDKIPSAQQEGIYNVLKLHFGTAKRSSGGFGKKTKTSPAVNSEFKKRRGRPPKAKTTP